MKYTYLPNCHIIDYEKQKLMFVLDASGEYETEDPKLIEWMAKNKNFIRCEKSVKAINITKPEVVKNNGRNGKKPIPKGARITR